jgi:Protein of unknown function (DUF2955)
MSASTANINTPVVIVPKTREILRYAFGSAIIMAVAMGMAWPVSMLTPVLALMFIGSPAPSPTLKQGLGFVFMIAIASGAGLFVARFLLPYPLVFIPFIGLILLHVFYATPKQIPPFLKLFLLLTLSATPFLGLQTMMLAYGFAMALIVNGAATIVLVWFVYGIFPDRRTHQSAKQVKQVVPAIPDNVRFQNALVSTIVVFPALLLFFFFEWVSALTALIMIMILAMQPGFAKGFKAGGLLILANIAGGIGAIIAYELLVITPSFVLMFLLVVLFGLIYGAGLFSNKLTAQLYGTAFSTFLLIIGMTTSGEAEADAKVYTRILLIMIAVVYVVVASGIVTALLKSFTRSKSETGLAHE